VEERNALFTVLFKCHLLHFGFDLNYLDGKRDKTSTIKTTRWRKGISSEQKTLNVAAGLRSPFETSSLSFNVNSQVSCV